MKRRERNNDEKIYVPLKKVLNALAEKQSRAYLVHKFQSCAIKILQILKIREKWQLHVKIRQFTEE